MARPVLISLEHRAAICVNVTRDDVATCAPNNVKGHCKQSHVWERPCRTHNEKWQRHIVARRKKRKEYRYNEGSRGGERSRLFDA